MMVFVAGIKVFGSRILDEDIEKKSGEKDLKRLEKTLMVPRKKVLILRFCSRALKKISSANGLYRRQQWS